MPTYQARRNHWRKQFNSIGLPTADLDARLLLLHVAGIEAAKLISIELNEISDAHSAEYDEFCERRIKGEPIARILGFKEFYGYSFSLNNDTLVPRPDTELLVDKLIEKLPDKGCFLDLGTGSGAIAISTLLEKPNTTGVATDLSSLALSCALSNAQKHSVDNRLQFLQGSWFTPIGERMFDVIASNPPYICRSELADMNNEALLFDPELALFAEDDGLAAYKVIAGEAGRYLSKGGWLMFEVGHRQGDAVSALLASHNFTNIEVFEDLSGHQRVVVGQR